MSITELQNVLPQPVEQDTGPGLAEYLGIFRRRLKLILVPFFLCFILSAIVVYVVPAKFNQRLVFRIEDPGITKNILAGIQATVTHKPLLRTMSADIKSRRFLRPIVAKVGLTEGFNLNSPLEETEFYGQVFKSLAVQVPDVRSRASEGPDVVTLAYTGRIQSKNVEFLNEIYDSYKEHFRRRYRETIRGIHDQQRARLRDMRNELARLEASYEKFRNGEDYHLVGVKRGHLRQLADLSDREMNLRLDIKGLEAQISKIKAQLRDQNKTSSIMNRQINPQISVVREQMVQAKKDLNQMIDVDTGKGWTDKVPAVINQRAKITKLKEKMRELPPTIDGGETLQVNQVFVELQNDRNELQRRLDGARDTLTQVVKQKEVIDGELSKETNLTRSDSSFQVEISALQTKEANVTSRFEKISSEWKRIQGEGSDLFQIVDFPNPNTKPVFPSVPLFLAIGAGVGALLGLGLAFLKEFSSQTYLTPSQVQHRLTVPILGEVSEIKTEEELAEEKAKKRRNYLAIGFVVAVLAFVHYCYFESSMTGILPPIVVEILDMLYKGG